MRLVRATAVTLLVIAVAAFVLGARVVAKRDVFRCEDGSVAVPVGIMDGVYQCQTLPDNSGRRQTVMTRDEVALYLTNVQVRVFDLDFASGVHHWVEFGIPFSASVSPMYDVWINNGTTMTVTMVVNNALPRPIGPHTQVAVSAADLPPLPWSIETRTTRGRVLASMTVRDGDVQATANADGSRSIRGDATRVDLSCGRLDVWVGPPLLGPGPGPGSPGDCDP